MQNIYSDEHKTVFNNKIPENCNYQAEYYGRLVEEIRKIKSKYPDYSIHDIITNILRMKINNKLMFFQISKRICLPDGMILNSKDFPFIQEFENDPNSFIKVSNFKDVEHSYLNDPIIQNIKITLTKMSNNQGFIDDLLYSIIIHDDFDDFASNQGKLMDMEFDEYSEIMNKIKSNVDEYLKLNN